MLKERFCKSYDGTRIFYQYYAPSKKKPVLVITNLLGRNRTVYRNLFQHFRSNNTPILTYDLRNHGHSARGASSLQNMIHDLECILDKEKITKPILVGLSLSGKIPLYFHLKHPEKTKAMILSNFPTDDSLTIKSKLLSLLIKMVVKSGIKGRKDNKRDLDLSKKKDPSIPVFVKDLFTQMSAADFCRMADVLLRAKPDMNQIKCPTIMYTFSKDAYAKRDPIQQIEHQNIHTITLQSQHQGPLSEKHKPFREVLYEMYNKLSQEGEKNGKQ